MSGDVCHLREMACTFFSAHLRLIFFAFDGGRKRAGTAATAEIVCLPVCPVHDIFSSAQPRN